MIPSDSFVRLDKLSAQRDGPLPTGYWCKGFLMEEPTIGHTLRMLRIERAKQRPDEVEPVKVAGLYVSSPVRELIENEDGSVTAHTQNSSWRITLLEAAPPSEVQTAGDSASGLDTAP